MRRQSGPTGLVLAPTRELATQIAGTLEPLAAAYYLKVTTILGGVPQNRQVAALTSGIDIVVACPCRLEDLMKQCIVNLDSVQITVADEADHMADLGFLPGVTRILAATPRSGQRLLFSATLDDGVDKLVKRFLRNEMTHSVDEAHSPVPEMTHHVFHVAGVQAKKELVHQLASGNGRRNLAAFTAGKARVLVATDIAARGVRVDAVELVVHVDPPTEHKAYLHRSVLNRTRRQRRRRHQRGATRTAHRHAGGDAPSRHRRPPTTGRRPLGASRRTGRRRRSVSGSRPPG